MTGSWGPPAGLDIELQRAGVWWDAVKVHMVVGDNVLTALGDKNGAVIRDTWSHYLYWFIRPGSAAEWRLEPAEVLADTSWVRILGDTGHIAVPPDGKMRGPGPHWAVLPEPQVDGGRTFLTDGLLLHAALQGALLAKVAASGHWDPAPARRGR